MRVNDFASGVCVGYFHLLICIHYARQGKEEQRRRGKVVASKVVEKSKWE